MVMDILIADKNVNLDRYWDILFDDDMPYIYKFIPGGHFVTKEQILLK
jgi:hypothetical protein